MIFRLPQDVYQVAKVSKILQILEKGTASQFKNMSLDEINLDMETLDTEMDDDQETYIDKSVNESETNHFSFNSLDENGRNNVEINYNVERFDPELYEEESVSKTMATYRNYNKENNDRISVVPLTKDDETGQKKKGEILFIQNK